MKTDEKAEIRKLNLGQVLLKEVPVLKYLKTTGNCENEGENKYGDNANYKVRAFKPQNTRIMVLLEEIIKEEL